MPAPSHAKQVCLPDILKKYESEILDEWIKNQLSGELAGSSGGMGRIDERQLKDDCKRFLSLLREAVSGGELDIGSSRFVEVKGMLADLSRSRAVQGFTSTQTASFVLSLKKPIFQRLRRELGKDSEVLADEIWTTTELLDDLGLYTMETYLEGREGLIRRQQEEMMELSTPVVQLWEGVLALPLIGTLDSARTQVVMESLLEQIVRTGSTIAIIDITGVPTVDTLVAQHLLKTVAAARLMGAECIISGIRPQIAQTIVHLGVALGDVVTKATLADAFGVAMRRKRLQVVSAEGHIRQWGGGSGGGANGAIDQRATRPYGSSGSVNLPGGSSGFGGGY
jgi:rsbT co-antagonist protein RsbR